MKRILMVGAAVAALVLAGQPAEADARLQWAAQQDGEWVALHCLDRKGEDASECRALIADLRMSSQVPVCRMNRALPCICAAELPGDKLDIDRVISVYIAQHMLFRQNAGLAIIAALGAIFPCDDDGLTTSHLGADGSARSYIEGVAGGVAAYRAVGRDEWQPIGIFATADDAAAAVGLGGAK